MIIKSLEYTKYKDNIRSEFYKYKLEDGTLLDNSYHTTVYLNDKIIREVNTLMTLTEDQIQYLLSIQPLVGKPINSIYNVPVVLDINNPIWTFVNKKITKCWIVKTDKRVEAMDIVTGELIAYKSCPSLNSISYCGQMYENGPTSCWYGRKNDATFWFSKWGLSVNSYSRPDKNIIKNEILSNNIDYYFSVAHGGHLSCVLYYDGITPVRLYASDIEDWMSDRNPVKFAFLGHCDAMNYTGNGSFTKAFTKGETDGTVVIGYANLTDYQDAINYWHLAIPLIFEEVNNGNTFYDAFNMTFMLYPMLEPVMVFYGDKTLKLESNIVINKITQSATKVNINDEYKVFVELENKGLSGKVPLEVNINDVLQYEVEQQVDGGESKSIEFDFKFEEEGVYNTCIDIKVS
jgi:hypothetical protein